MPGDENFKRIKYLYGILFCPSFCQASKGPKVPVFIKAIAMHRHFVPLRALIV
jgi:hypothetical protein